MRRCTGCKLDDSCRGTGSPCRSELSRARPCAGCSASAAPSASLRSSASILHVFAAMRYERRAGVGMPQHESTQLPPLLPTAQQVSTHRRVRRVAGRRVDCIYHLQSTSSVRQPAQSCSSRTRVRAAEQADPARQMLRKFSSKRACILMFVLQQTAFCKGGQHSGLTPTTAAIQTAGLPYAWLRPAFGAVMAQCGTCWMSSSSGAGSVFLVAARASSSSSDPSSPPVGRCRVNDFNFCIICWAWRSRLTVVLVCLVGWPGGTARRGSRLTASRLVTSTS